VENVGAGAVRSGDRDEGSARVVLPARAKADAGQVGVEVLQRAVGVAA
jgi:hypothetical protein